MYTYYRRGTSTATAESEEARSRLIARGYERCTASQHRAAWKARDWQAFAEMWEELECRAVTAPIARAVGGVPPDYVRYGGF